MRSLSEIQADAARAVQTHNLEVLRGCVEEMDTLQTPESTASAQSMRGVASYLSGDLPQAFQSFTRAIELHEAVGQTSEVSGALTNIGNIHAATGDFPAALESFTRALALHENLGNRMFVAQDIGNIGNVYSSIGDYPAALKQYHRAMALYEEIGYRFGLATVYGSLGILHRRIGDHATALDYSSRALLLYEELGNRHLTAIAYSNIGNVHFGNADFTEALEFYYRACALHHEIGNHDGVRRVNPNILTALIELGSVAEALDLLALIDKDPLEDPELKVTIEFCRARLQEQQGDLDAASRTVNAVLTHARRFDLRSSVADAHKQLRDLAQKRNDFAGYIEHNNAHTQILEEINGKNTATQFAMLEAERRIAGERQEHQKHLAVLHATLPKEIADRVARGETVSDHFDHAAVLFLDIAGFTTHSSELLSHQVTALLEEVFRTFDAICKEHGVTKVKTIGDAYLCFAGSDIGERVSDVGPEYRIAAVALAMQDAEFYWPTATANSNSKQLSANSNRLQFRIGMHSGPVTAGVIGTERLQYDVWGDTVNVASRMESTGEPGRIQVSEAFAQLLLAVAVAENDGTATANSQQQPKLAERGEVSVKGKGTMKTHWLETNGNR